MNWFSLCDIFLDWMLLVVKSSDQFIWHIWHTNQSSEGVSCFKTVWLLYIYIIHTRGACLTNTYNGDMHRCLIWTKFKLFFLSRSQYQQKFVLFLRLILLFPLEQKKTSVGQWSESWKRNFSRYLIYIMGINLKKENIWIHDYWISDLCVTCEAVSASIQCLYRILS